MSSEGESHFHPCPGCQSAVECTLAIGDGDCGKLRCDSCSPKPKLKPNTSVDASSGHTLNNTWVCVNGCMQPDNKTTECPKCNAPRPKIIGTCASCGFPISEYYPNKCWNGHPQPGASADSEDSEDDDEEDDEEEAESCDNCGEDITPENPAREFDGNDMCKSCYPICSTCAEELAGDSDEWSRCNSCSDYICKDCRWWCHCCEVYMCKGCANNGDHGISQD